MKKINAAKEGLNFLLCEAEIVALLQAAGITVEDWAFMGYHLSRYNDEGHYTIGNCRFIPYRVNYAEKKISEKSRQTSREKMERINRNLTFEARSRNGKLGIKGGENKLTNSELKRRFDLIQHLDFDKKGFYGRASEILGISYSHVRRLCVRWRAMNLMLMGL